MITAKDIEKYKNRSIPWLKAKSQQVFNKWVRDRDAGNCCISCPSFNTSDASHYFSRGSHPALALEPDNCHLSCKKCNLFLSGNLIPYRENLINKIGTERMESLENLAVYFKRNAWKPDRFYYISKIIQYK